MTTGSDASHDQARRFRDAALPLLDDVYTLARYLLRNAADAEDAVQECYLRALRHFDTYRGPEIKPWLFAILRNVIRGEFARRSCATLTMDGDTAEDADAIPLWQEPPPTPESEILADVVGAPVGTVMSRLARARCMLRQAWIAAEQEEGLPT
jgi:RNA polymerase sigma-70 factor, ECF subfamily